MKRSTYSLILMDDVVAAIDRLAAQQGTSRSNLINQILAEHVSCVTPEQQMRQIFACLTQQMNSAFRIQEQGSDAISFQFLVLCSTSTVRPSATAWNCIVKCTAKRLAF